MPSKDYSAYLPYGGKPSAVLVPLDSSTYLPYGREPSLVLVPLDSGAYLPYGGKPSAVLVPLGAGTREGSHSHLDILWLNNCSFFPATVRIL